MQGARVTALPWSQSQPAGTLDDMAGDDVASLDVHPSLPSTASQQLSLSHDSREFDRSLLLKPRRPD